MTFGRNFLPGPTGVHPDLLTAMTAPMFAHYTPVMRPFLEEVQPALREMFGTQRPVFSVTCSGSGLLESAIRNGVRERVLVIDSGFFGGYFATIAERCGKEVIRIHVPLGQTLEAEQLEALLDGPEVDAVALVHSESSAGSLAPLETLAPVVRRRPDTMLLVDAVSSAAATPIEMDRLGIDFVVAGSQKAMALPPGLAFGAASERLEARARTLPNVGHYFSVPRWVRMAAEYDLFETPALSLHFALHRQIQRIAESGGWAARWARHQALAGHFAEWAAQQPGVELLARPGRRSPAVSVIRLTAGQNPELVAGRLAEEGFLVGKSIDPAHGPLLRIGHMGDIELHHLDQLLALLTPLLRPSSGGDH